MIRFTVKIRTHAVSSCAQAVGMHSFTTAFLHSISDLHLNSESSNYLPVQSGQPDFLELQTGGSVINSGELNSRYISWVTTLC